MEARVDTRRLLFWRIAAGLALFALGFAVANRFQLTHAVLYRAAANDLSSAASNFLLLAAQALGLLAAVVLLSRRMFALALLLAGASILINLGYGQTVNDIIDMGKLAWMLGEARQAGNAAGEFARPLLLGGLQAVAAVALLIAARIAFHDKGRAQRRDLGVVVSLAVLALPSLALAMLGSAPVAAERNLYGLAMGIALAEPPPPRQAVSLRPRSGAGPRHIVWLVDESVAHRQFHALIGPRLARFAPVDFGVAASLGNCSAPANVALRSGVDVRQAGPRTDLRATPSIWAYARKAGYRTLLIDGQTSGAPQNLLLPPERTLIDEIRSRAGGIDTDGKIADELNRQFRSEGRSFTYVILRGVHFQYKDHYPPGAIPAESPAIKQYEAALPYSKGRFFERLLDGVDRETVAVVYTSDHGQNLAPDVLPHCSRAPVADEFRVPLLAFLPRGLAARYGDSARSGRSASQIFPTTLIWMGYDPDAVQARYDNALTEPTARYVWFDRNVLPIRTGDPIGVTAGPTFPGLPEP